MDLNLQSASALSSIATFIITAIATVVGLWGYFSYRMELYRKRCRLEQYLENEKAKPNDKGQRSLLHLVRYVGLTEDEIIKICFKSKKIQRRIKKDEKGYAESLLFEYVSP